MGKNIPQQLQMQTLITHILYMYNYHSNFYLQYAKKKKKIRQISNIEILLNFQTDCVIYFSGFRSNCPGDPLREEAPGPCV